MADEAAHLPENQQMAWLGLALEVYRSHDRVFSTPVQYDKAYLKALRRLLESLPALRGMMGNVFLSAADRAYVEDLVARIERFCPAQPGAEGRARGATGMARRA